MKKRLTAIFLAAAMACGGAPAMAADGGMEAALVSVKSRIDIPAELDIFNSSTYTDDNKTTYSFTWRDAGYKANVSVAADGDGHITAYDYYSNSLYDGQDAVVYKTREEYFEAAESFIKKAAPELFRDEDDRLVRTESSGAIRDNTASFGFVRQRDGVPVVGNTANVTVRYVGGGFAVTYCNIRWDYKTGFENAEGSGVIEPGAYYDRFPLEQVYRKPVKYYRSADAGEDKAELIYRFKNYTAGYMSVYSRAAVEPDDNAIYDRGYASAGGGGGANAKEEAADLTPEERAEVDSVAGLKPAEDITASVSAMAVFGAIPAADSFSKRIYKQNDKYYVGLSYSDYKNLIEKTGKPASVYITADGQTGELLRFSSYYYSGDHDAQYSKEEHSAAEDKINAFLTAQFSGKLAACGEPEISGNNTIIITYPRLVNGVRYVNNYLSAEYTMQNGLMTGFSQEWDDDTTGFTDPAAAIEYEAAVSKMEEYAPVHTVYLKTGGKFRLCCTSDGANTEIDAVSGDKLKPRYGTAEPEVYEYTDISGHWAEQYIKAVAQYGAGLPGTEFRPDTAITQSELLKMLTAARYYGSTDEDAMYESAQDIIPADEKAPDGEVLREDAFVYMIRLMGYARIASMDIFVPGFADGTDISPEKAGALAILRGYGIVQGDDVSVRPKAALTRAEAAALLYNYLTTEK